uniref:CTP synthase (glutamine hydrolyzing) n=1 Tax=Ditylenchus dipsaci TaxID=166011 RepID=A0A915CTJ5_9BILA
MKRLGRHWKDAMEYLFLVDLVIEELRGKSQLAHMLEKKKFHSSEFALECSVLPLNTLAMFVELKKPIPQNSKNSETEEQVCIEMLEHNGKNHGMGATMRLGKRTTVFLTEDSVLRKLYGDKESVEERHRHRYEVNPAIVPKVGLSFFYDAGLLFVGMGVDETKNQDNVQTRTESSAALVQMHNLSQAIIGWRQQHYCCSNEMLELLGHPYYTKSAILRTDLGRKWQLEGYLSGSKIPSPVELLVEENGNVLQTFMN